MGQDKSVTFQARSVRSGKWSEPATWADGHAPKAGDNVQIRAGHTVTYDVNSADALRVVHVAGTLTFARDKSTRLDVGLLKVIEGEACTEDGFNCHESADMPAAAPGTARPALELGTTEQPIPSGVTATVRLVHFAGMDTNTLPAIVVCGGRWDVHGAPMNRTWVKLGASAKAGDSSVTLAEPVTGWRVGDRVILTASKGKERSSTFRQSAKKHQPVSTEERLITAVSGATLTLDRVLENEHFGVANTRSEVANLSRNVVIESAAPDGVRGHTMYHRDSAGGISYAEFRHLGKEGVLGKYSIHFHLVRDSMRGSGVTGASIWDSHNRWITIHGTDYLLVRDCVGYQSAGHGFFLEDGTEQYNVLDRNLAVQAYRTRPLPKQVLPFDANDGAGFWWANGRNSFTRNVACENDEYGYRFEIAKRSNFNPELNVRQPDGTTERRDVRTIPFFRFEANESHSEGLYSFNFGDDVPGAVHGDRRHPFVARDLLAWQTHYVLRPNLQFFLMDGLDVKDGVYGVYHPDYDAHVYRNIRFDNVNSEPINRGHDDDSIQYGSFTYENVLLENCRIGRDPLIQLTCTSPQPGQSGHFRNLTVKNSSSRYAQVVDLGGGPRNDKLQNPVIYYFHDYFGHGEVTKVASVKFPDQVADAKPVAGFTGPDVRAAEVKGVAFPALLDPIDDLPPATLITSKRASNGKLVVRGVSHDNGDIARVTVNGQTAKILSTSAGIVDWEITLNPPADGALTALATDKAGNTEKMPHRLLVK
ncbi:MAG: G8 domain-containing protein [Verrucomicrobia bacterium]|nr:G8 domain-containing protein [Verrucomicrobiota bacterium]